MTRPPDSCGRLITRARRAKRAGRSGAVGVPGDPLVGEGCRSQALKEGLVGASPRAGLFRFGSLRANAGATLHPHADFAREPLQVAEAVHGCAVDQLRIDLGVAVSHDVP